MNYSAIFTSLLRSRPFADDDEWDTKTRTTYRLSESGDPYIESPRSIYVVTNCKSYPIKTVRSLNELSWYRF